MRCLERNVKLSRTTTGTAQPRGLFVFGRALAPRWLVGYLIDSLSLSGLMGCLINALEH